VRFTKTTIPKEKAMVHQDQGRKNNSRTHAAQLLLALGWLFGGVSLNIIMLRQEALGRHKD
jgi:hypothetical protein